MSWKAVGPRLLPKLGKDEISDITWGDHVAGMIIWIGESRTQSSWDVAGCFQLKGMKHRASQVPSRQVSASELWKSFLNGCVFFPPSFRVEALYWWWYIHQTLLTRGELSATLEIHIVSPPLLTFSGKHVTPGALLCLFFFFLAG